ncbi:MAG: cache domain-containing protein [Campylobacterales bacterium]|nr:cache domain-containing protein [Campylobacterales bacterium]
MYGAFLFFIFTLFFIAINFFQNYLHFSVTSQKMKEDYFANQQRSLSWEVKHFVDLIQTRQRQHQKELEVLLKEEVAKAHALATNLYATYRHTTTPQELQRLIIEALRPIRYMEGSGYFFITRNDGVKILFPDGPEYEGKNLLHVSTPSKLSYVQEFLALTLQQEEGFYTYAWSKPGEPKDRLFEKTAFFKRFEPYGWTISTGLYHDDMRAKLQEKILEDIGLLQFDPEGENYLFIGQWDGISLTAPAKGKNMYNTQDVNGKFLVQELIQTAKQGGGFVDYVMPDLEEKRTLNKRSYVQAIPEWEWYVGAGVYTDDIHERVALEYQKLNHSFFISLASSLALFGLAAFIMSVFYRRFNRQLKADFDAFFSFFDSLAHHNYPINKTHLRFYEFDALATSANAMLMQKLSLEKQLAHLAHHDALTALPNRALLSDRIAQGIATCKRENQLLALCFIDLDNFKKINDSFGHSYGDAALLQVVERTRHTLRETDTLARLGGDEFVLVLDNITHKDQVTRILEKIQKTFETPFLIHKQPFFLTASIGVSFYPSDGEEGETLLKNADLAMYKAKDAGKNSFRFYDRTLSNASMEMLTIENELKSAIANNEFEVYYQPQIDLQTNQCVGLEALIRWNHPEQGLLGPNRFIPYAEESRMILPIGTFVLKQACLDLVCLHETLGFKGKVSVNISGIQLENDDFTATLEEILHQTRIPPSSLELEITESIFMKDAVRWIGILEKIRSLGVKIAIDDFGTGYSSLSYLRRLPVDKLKIDISFVRDLPHHEDAKAIAKAIIVLAKSMHMTTLAEGIETQEQAAFLTQEGCDEGQGFYYEKGIDLSSLQAWINTQNTRLNPYM